MEILFIIWALYFLGKNYISADTFMIIIALMCIAERIWELKRSMKCK